MSNIYRVISGEYVTKILSEQNISIDYVELDSIQSMEDFSEFTNPAVRYKADDFLICISNENEEILRSKNSLGLSNTKQFGWYYGKIHKSEIQLYSATNPKKLNRLTYLNPKLIIDSFDKYRKYFRPIKATNILNGAFGLAYSVFKEDYDNFFRKIKIQKDKWIINKSILEKSDYPILTHLFLYYNAETKGLDKTLLISDELKGVRIFGFFLETALNYFINNDYSMDNFLTRMKVDFGKYPELKVFADNFKLLNDRYVKKGLSIDTKNPITIATKEFIDLAKTESENLNELLTQDNLNKTSVFLLGMLNLGDRIDEQFSFDNFVPSIVTLTMCHIADIQDSEKEVIISFNQIEIEKNRNNKFDYVKNYFNELHLLNEFTDELNILTKKSNLFKKIYESQTEIIELDIDSKDLENEIERFELQKENLIDQAKESNWFEKKYEEWINSQNEKECLEKTTKSLSDEISALNDDKKDYEKEESTLQEEIVSLKFKIKTLKQTIKSLNLKKDGLKSTKNISKNTYLDTNENEVSKTILKPEVISEKKETVQEDIFNKDKNSHLAQQDSLGSRNDPKVVNKNKDLSKDSHL
jgi:hypothetical protein